MATVLDNKNDVLVRAEKSMHSSGTSVSTPFHGGGNFLTEMEVDLYEEKQNVHTILSKLTQCLEVREPELLCTREKKGILASRQRFPMWSLEVPILAQGKRPLKLLIYFGLGA